MNLCNELATRTGAARVSLGWVKGDKIKLKAMSHTEQFDKKQELSVMIERVMEECLDQEEIVQFDPTAPARDNVTREAQQLSRMQGGETRAVAAAAPRRDRRRHHARIRPRQEARPAGRRPALAVAVDLLAPQLYDRYQNDRWLITKTGISDRETCARWPSAQAHAGQADHRRWCIGGAAVRDRSTSRCITWRRRSRLTSTEKRIDLRAVRGRASKRSSSQARRRA